MQSAISISGQPSTLRRPCSRPAADRSRPRRARRWQRSSSACGVASSGQSTQGRRVLLFDVMDTLVTDPFYEHMPRHFGMTFKELLATKHPSTWITFEKGHCSHEEAMQEFFADGRQVDGDALKAMMVAQYEYLPGAQELLQQLQQAGHEMHIVSNYPVWYEWIEEKLRLSQYLPWTFVSCKPPMQGLRKPDAKVFDIICEHLGVDAAHAVLIDDRAANVEAAKQAGLDALHMRSVEQLRSDLGALGVLAERAAT